MKTFKVNAIRQIKVGHKPYLVTVNNYSFETDQAYLFDSAKVLEYGEISDSNELADCFSLFSALQASNDDLNFTQKEFEDFCKDLCYFDTSEMESNDEQEAIKKAIENIKIGLSDPNRLNVFSFEVTNSDGNIIGYAEFEITLNEIERTLNASAINDEFCKESEVSVSVEADASYYEHLETLYTSIIEKNGFY